MLYRRLPKEGIQESHSWPTQCSSEFNQSFRSYNIRTTIWLRSSRLNFFFLGRSDQYMSEYGSPLGLLEALEFQATSYINALNLTDTIERTIGGPHLFFDGAR